MRYKLTEPTYILGKFSTGATVTLALYDLADESAVALTSNSCNEVGVLGVFAFSTANIATQPTVKKEYLWVMTDGAETQYGKIVLGGYPDQLDDTVSSRLASSGYTAPDNAGIAALPILSEIEASTVLAKEATLQTIHAALEIVRKVSGNRIRLNAETKQIEVYEDDGVTVAFAFNGLDADGEPSIDGVYDRVPV
jgi:hypothetical protein